MIPGYIGDKIIKSGSVSMFILLSKIISFAPFPFPISF